VLGKQFVRAARQRQLDGIADAGHSEVVVFRA